jgi:hypothetical protein
MLGGDQRITFPSEARCRHPRHAVPGDLADPGRGPSLQSFTNSGEVLFHRGRFVAYHFGDVERIVRPLRDAAEPGEKPDAGSRRFGSGET